MSAYTPSSTSFRTAQPAQDAHAMQDVSAAQRRASDPASSVWVSASAGSGKTKVLADRVTRLLLDDVPPEKILCLTFTRAAAAEMSIRLTQRLSRWAICPEDELEGELEALVGAGWPEEWKVRARRLLARVLECAGGLRLMTIHAFAQEILRRFPLEAGLPPTFAVVEEAESKALWEKAQNDVLRAIARDTTHEAAKAFAYLTAQMAAPTIETIIQEVRKAAPRLTHAAQQAGGLAALMGEARAALALEPDDTELRFCHAAVAEGAFDRPALLRAARAIAEKGSPKFAAPAQKILTWLEAASEEERLGQWNEASTTGANQSLPPCGEGSENLDLRSKSLVFAGRGLNNTSGHPNPPPSFSKDLLRKSKKNFPPPQGGRSSLAAGWKARFDDYISAFLTDKGTCRAEFMNKEMAEKEPAFAQTMGEEARRLLRVRERCEACQCVEETEAALTLGLAMSAAYDRAKQRRSVLDFDDLIDKTLALLSKGDSAAWVLYKLDGGIDHLLLDEAQDTSPAQWEIVKILAQEFFAGKGSREAAARSLFVVGDEKQSIYSFLKADPRVFGAMRSYFDALIARAQRRLTPAALNVSFRSAPAILEAVDAVFAGPAARRGVCADAPHHQAFRQKIEGRVTVWPLFVAPEEERKNPQVKTPQDWTLPVRYQTAHNPSAALAESVARQIKAWVEGGESVYDRTLGARRAMSYGDVLVLVQKRSAFVPQLISALKAIDVAVSGADRMRLMEQLAVMDVLALLQFTLLPEDDLTLACVLRSPFIGLPEEALMRLCAPRGAKSLWAAIKDDAEPSVKIIASYLSQVRALAESLPPLPLLIALLSQPCPADPISARRAIAARLGPEAEDPLDELLTAAELFSARHAPSLQAFLAELTGAAPEIKREMEGAAASVRIMTVHGAKGLEAPVVILPDAAAKPTRKTIDPLLWDEEANAPFYLPRTPLNAHLAALREEAFSRVMEEYRRLLYVALTRSAERLYIGGFAKAPPKDDADSWYALCSQALAPLHQEALMADETKSVIAGEIVIGQETPRAHVIENLSAASDGAAQTFSALPAFALTPPAPEPSPPRPLVPSRPSEEEERTVPATLTPTDARFARGRIIHSLLQYLPELPEAARAAAAARFLAGAQHRLSAEAQDAIRQEVLALLAAPAFAPLFGPHSRAEVPLVGLAGSRLIAGQVDRLAEVEGEVWIVDYKTNRPPPKRPEDIPPAYRAQKEAYRTVLRAVYPPERRVRCFLLWTFEARLMEVE